jgi:hypothetical protein
MASDRRTFLKRAALTAATAATTAAVPATTRAQGAATTKPGTPAQQPAQQARTLDPVLLTAVGDAVLPESLGAPGRAGAVAAFSGWLARYQPVAEEMHGYGDAEITYTPSDPAPGWSAQLAGLDLLARRKHRRSFARLGVPLRREVLRAALARVPGSRLPSNPLVASHVAVALLAHWAASSAAADLAYGAHIMRENCRGLASVTSRPLPLAPGDGR